MSEMYMEQSFPLADHPEASKLREIADQSLYGENANPLAESQWADDAVVYVRSDMGRIFQGLDDAEIVLSPAEEAQLIDFASAYASLKDDEEDMQLQREGEYDD